MLIRLNMFKMSVVKIGRLCHRQQAYFIYSLCPSHTICAEKVCVFHRQYVSWTYSTCLCQTVCVCHKKSVPFQELFLSQKVCFCLILFVSQKASVCQSVFFCYQTLFLITLRLTFTYLYMILISRCLWDFCLSGILIPIIPTLWTSSVFIMKYWSNTGSSWQG